MSTVSNGSKKGQDTDPSSEPIRIDPSLIKAADEAMDAMDELLSDAPPTSRTQRRDSEPPLPGSRLAVRADGALLISLEDADDRDLSGREIVRCLVLRPDEASFVAATASDAFDDIAARLIGQLPRAS